MKNNQTKYIIVVSVILWIITSSCGLVSTAPRPGDWTAKTDFGSVVFTINPDGTKITKAVFNLENFRCGPGSVSGSVGLEFGEDQKIEQNKFQ